MNDNTAEVKRLYARVRAKGVGTAVLKYLEKHAHAMGYTALWVETRQINSTAVSFYEQSGYSRIANYGKYAGNPEAVCFEKKL